MVLPVASPEPGRRSAFGGAGLRQLWVVGIVLLINGVVLWNAICHDPHIGYDTYQHLQYVEVLSACRLPSVSESSEFFSPPLPYALPAAARAAGLSLSEAAKFGQLSQVLLSLGLTLLLLRTCQLIRPGISHSN
jgi:hypothetical protein